MTARTKASAVLLAAALCLVACAAPPSARGRALPIDTSTRLVYVALGDSTVRGIGATRPELNYVGRLHERVCSVYPRATLTNLGVNGATSKDVVSRQLDRAIALDPGLVTLSVGPNDITRGLSVESYEQNIATIFGRVWRETRALLVVNLIPDLAATPRYARGPLRDKVGHLTVVFNEVLRREAARHDVVLVDLYEASRRMVPIPPRYVALDGYHPSDEGYAGWADLVWPAIAARAPAPNGTRCGE